MLRIIPDLENAFKKPTHNIFADLNATYELLPKLSRLPDDALIRKFIEEYLIHEGYTIYFYLDRIDPSHGIITIGKGIACEDKKKKKRSKGIQIIPNEDRLKDLYKEHFDWQIRTGFGPWEENSWVAWREPSKDTYPLFESWHSQLLAEWSSIRQQQVKWHKLNPKAKEVPLKIKESFARIRFFDPEKKTLDKKVDDFLFSIIEHEYLPRARRNFRNFDKYPDDARLTILDWVYQGAWKSKTFRENFKEEWPNFAQAAKELPRDIHGKTIRNPPRDKKRSDSFQKALSKLYWYAREKQLWEQATKRKDDSRFRLAPELEFPRVDPSIFLHGEPEKTNNAPQLPRIPWLLDDSFNAD